MDEIAASNPTRPAGHYTDDTLLLLSLAEAIVGAGGAPPSNTQCAEAAVAAWRANEASPLKGLRGFGSGTQRVIEALAEGSATPDATGRMVRPEGSNRNGAVMRIAPLGLLFSDRALDDTRHWSVLGELRAAVADAIKFSHDNEDAVDGAASVAYLVARGAAATVAGFEEMHADAKRLLGFIGTNVCKTEILKGMFASLAQSSGAPCRCRRRRFIGIAKSMRRACVRRCGTAASRCDISQWRVYRGRCSGDMCVDGIAA